MDRKSIVILSISVVLFVLWTPMVNKLFPPVPAPTNQVSIATSPGNSNRSSISNGNGATASAAPNATFSA